MRRFELSDEQWGRVEGLLPGRPGRSGDNNRLFLDAVLWIARTGAPWRDLPERFGDWNRVFQRFHRRAPKGVWQRVFDALPDPDLEGRHARCHDCSSSRSCGGRSKKSGDQQLGRSRRRFGTKIHAACDGLGNPVKFLRTPGQTHDITQAAPLLEGLAAEQVIANNGWSVKLSTRCASSVRACCEPSSRPLKRCRVGKLLH